MNSVSTSVPVHRTGHHSHRAGLRTVAIIEALKGLLALLVSFLIIRAIHHDVDFEDLGERLLSFLHIDPDRHLSQMFLNAADKMSDVNVMLIAALAAAYALLRFLEGYGLWKQRAWAEWLAIISGCVYIPFEVYKLVRHPNEFHWALLGINIVVVLYIAWVRWDEITAARRQRSEMAGERN